MRPYDYVPTGELDQAPLRTAISPMPTAFTVIRDALQDGRRGTPSALRKSIVTAMRSRDIAAFAPVTDPEAAGWPTLLDAVEGPRETLDGALQRIAATSADTVLEALENDRDVTLTAGWDVVRRNPDRWLRGYVDAVQRGWLALEPWWRRSAALLEREEERIDAAIDRGVPHAQIALELTPRTSLVDDVLRFRPTPDGPRHLAVGATGLTVVPMVASAGLCTVASPGDFIVRLDYSLPQIWRAFEDRAPAPASLEALLGWQRSALLQRLESPHTAGRIAELLGLSPSTTTFHLRALEAAGLIARERQGRNIIVYRTSRGTQLLALYESP